MELEIVEGMILLKGTNQCLGNLMDFKERGVFDPKYGKVDVTQEQASTHNQLLDEAMVRGLLENCKIGQGGMSYLTEWKDCREQKRYKITTFTGTVISDNCHVISTGQRNKYGGFWLKVFFQAGGKSFEGKNNGHDQLVSFKRVK